MELLPLLQTAVDLNCQLHQGCEIRWKVHGSQSILNLFRESKVKLVRKGFIVPLTLDCQSVEPNHIVKNMVAALPELNTS